VLRQAATLLPRDLSDVPGDLRCAHARVRAWCRARARVTGTEHNTLSLCSCPDIFRCSPVPACSLRGPVPVLLPACACLCLPARASASAVTSARCLCEPARATGRCRAPCRPQTRVGTLLGSSWAAAGPLWEPAREAAGCRCGSKRRAETIREGLSDDAVPAPTFAENPSALVNPSSPVTSSASAARSPTSPARPPRPAPTR
jgi:hypothetical protein